MRLFLLVVVYFFACSTFASKLKITFIVPDDKDALFWQLVNDVGETTANSLNIELEIIYTEINRFALKAAIDNITQRHTKPDYLIFRPLYGNTSAVFKQLEAAKINFVTLEKAFPPDVEARIGKPQEKLKHWLGQINYDNKAGGELLFNAMFYEHSKKSADEIMYVIGIGGDFDKVSKDRQLVLEKIRSTGDKKKIIINQIFPLHWQPALIQQRFPLMTQRYPNTNAYWCVGDEMALELLKAHKKNIGTPIIIGGFDWLPSMLKKIKEKEIVASVGGHFLMLSLAIIKIVDYDNGVNTFLNLPFLNKYELINIENVDRHFTFFEQKSWHQIDFSKFLHSTHKYTGPDLTVNELLMEVNK